MSQREWGKFGPGSQGTEIATDLTSGCNSKQCVSLHPNSELILAHFSI